MVGMKIARPTSIEPTHTRQYRSVRPMFPDGYKQEVQVMTHALQYARDMTTDLADDFVGMYVNDLTVDYGERGRKAVHRLLTEGFEAGLLPGPVAVEFSA